MQRFTLLHNESKPGWQATYLAFQIAARLGAPLLVLMMESASQDEVQAQQADQVEVGARAAGVSIDTHFLDNFTISALSPYLEDCNGLFMPQSLLPDGDQMNEYLTAISCPVWVIAREAKTRALGVLVCDWVTDTALVTSASVLAHRLQKPLLGLIPTDQFNRIPSDAADLLWVQIPNLNASTLERTLAGQSIDLLFLPASEVSCIPALRINCILTPSL